MWCPFFVTIQTTLKCLIKYCLIKSLSLFIWKTSLRPLSDWTDNYLYTCHQFINISDWSISEYGSQKCIHNGNIHSIELDVYAVKQSEQNLSFISPNAGKVENITLSLLPPHNSPELIQYSFGTSFNLNRRSLIPDRS